MNSQQNRNYLTFTSLMCEHAKKSIWYWIRPHGIRCKGRRDSLLPGRSIAMIFASLYRTLVFWACFSFFMAVTDKPTKSFPVFGIFSLSKSSSNIASVIDNNSFVAMVLTRVCMKSLSLPTGVTDSSSDKSWLTWYTLSAISTVLCRDFKTLTTRWRTDEAE